MPARTPSQQFLRLGLSLALGLLLVPMIELVTHRSQLPMVLGRWSRGYFICLSAYTVLLACTVLSAGLASRANPAQTDRIVAGIATLRRAHVPCAALMAAPWLLVWAGIDAMPPQSPGRSAVVQLTLAALALWCNCLLLLAGRPWAAGRTAIARLALALGGVTLGLTAAETFLRRHPAYIPDAARARLPGDGMFLNTYLVFDKPMRVGYRYQPNSSMLVRYRRSHGDLYRRQAHTLPPLDPKDDEVLAEIHLVADENGYPNPMPLRERYDIVTAGDSFTAPATVATPWPRVLERLTGLSVLNIAVPGYGVQQEAAAVMDYALARRPNWVVLAYFEGNDLITDAPAFERKRHSGLGWAEAELAQAGPYARSVALQTVRSALGAILSWAVASANAAAPRFPLMLPLGGRQVPVAFSDAYQGALTATRADIEASHNLAYVRDALLALRRATAEAGARLLIVYVPSKEHLYSALITDAAVMRHVLDGVQPVVLLPDGFLRSPNLQATAEQVWAHRDDQRDAIAHLLRQLDIDLLDLTPAFLAEAARGAELYYAADTHWNAAGHELAARLVAARLAAHQRAHRE